MLLQHSADVNPISAGSRHREITDKIRYLMQGNSGDKQNFQLMITRNDVRTTSPSHRHNFDQIRYCFDGSFEDGRGLKIRPGEIGYFPEGVSYSIDCAFSELMLIQFGGASGEGYTNHDRLAAAFPEVEKYGRFEGGIFYRDPETQSPFHAKTQQDGFEAMWEHVNGRPLTYPAGRFKKPILMKPDAMAWISLEGQTGVEHKHVATLTERRIEIAMYRLSDGASLALPGANAPRIMLVISGNCSASGHLLRKQSVLRFDSDETANIAADGDVELLSITLPWFAASELSENT